jgi:hypothetical protein
MDRIKKLKIAYGGVLGLFTIGILGSSVPSLLKQPYAVEHFCGVLKMPEYLLVFTGVTKLLGLVALYLQAFPRLKEWAFAGFAYDLIGAWYCNINGTKSFLFSMPVLLFMVVLAVLYWLNRKIPLPRTA